MLFNIIMNPYDKTGLQIVKDSKNKAVILCFDKMENLGFGPATPVVIKGDDLDSLISILLKIREDFNIESQVIDI